MAFYKQDIVDINLNTGNIHRSFLNHAIGYKNDDADRFGIRTFRDGIPQDLTGASCQAVFMAPNGSKIALTSYGTVSGNVAYVTLPPACYDYEGQFCLAIQLVGGGVTGTMRIVDGMVVNTGASGTVAPTSSVPTYQEIIAQYDAMVAATAAANGAIAATYSGSATYKVGDYCIHDGGLYRCTTAITTAEAWNAAHWTATKIGPDVSDLKTAFDESVLDTIKVPYSPDFSIVAGGVSSSGENNNLTTRSRTGYIDIKPGKTYAFHLDTTSYIFMMCWTYSNSSTANKLRKIETPNKNIIVIKAGTNDKKIRFAFADADPTIVMTDADRTAIASALKFYELTDESFTMTGTPADAKKTMEEITDLQNTVITRIENIEEETEKLPYGLGIIRDGTVFNEGNANAIATKNIIATKNADYIIAYCNVPLTEGHKYRFQFSTFSIENGDANESEAYCIRREIAIITTDTYCVFGVDKNEKGIAYAIFERDENDTNVQLRVSTFDVSKIYTEICQSICGKNYAIGADFLKKPVSIRKIGQLTYRQSFCKYNGNYYSVDDQGHISVQDSTFTETASATLSVGHGNAFQLGNNGYAYISGWNDHKVYKIDLSTLTIADTITLPTSSGRTGAVVDDINGIAYIFQTQSDTASTSENYNFIVYDYVNGEVLRTTKTTVAFGAMQACDYADDKIPLLNGKPSGSLANGLRIYDTNGKIIAKYILGEFADVEMEGIFIDRDNGDLYISDTNKYVYIVSNA